MVVHGYTWLYKVVKAAQGCTDKVVQGFTRFYKVLLEGKSRGEKTEGKGEEDLMESSDKKIGI